MMRYLLNTISLKNSILTTWNGYDIIWISVENIISKKLIKKPPALYWKTETEKGPDLNNENPILKINVYWKQLRNNILENKKPHISRWERGIIRRKPCWSSLKGLRSRNRINGSYSIQRKFGDVNGKRFRVQRSEVQGWGFPASPFRLRTAGTVQRLRENQDSLTV